MNVRESSAGLTGIGIGIDETIGKAVHGAKALS
jgi:hypothetical protein